MRLPLIALLCLLSLSVRAQDSDRERRKREFLSKPVFAETIRKREAEAKAKAEFSLSPRRVELPKQIRQAPETNYIQRPAQSSVVSTPSNSVGRPSSLPASVASRTDGQCGWNKFVENYCYYRQGNGWLLCTDRWGGCIQQEEL